MICPACQQKNPRRARHCLYCGRPLGPEATAHVSRLEGERRLVTVLFADVSGFTSLVERIDPEAACQLLNDCFDYLVPILEKYGGVVDKFIGDEVMALFGAPAAHEDDPARALHAALGMMAAMGTFNARHETTLDIHIGVNTGLVVSGNIGSRGRQAYTVIGDAVNLAARLEEEAGEGTILVGPDTYRHSAPLFDFAALSLQVKGRAEPLYAYRLLGRKARPGSLRGLAGLRSPMIGRDPEMETLLQRGAALQRGQGGTAVIIGEAGLGKSRLVSEWRAVLDASATKPVRWVQGQCLSYGQGLAYHLLTDLIRSLIGVPVSAVEPEARAALRAFVREYWGSARQVYAYLGHLLAIRLEGEDLERVRSLDPQALQAQYLVALRQVFTSLAARGPLALVCEDIHWADPSSADLLARLFPLVDEIPVLFCLVARPDQDAPGWRLITAARGLRQEKAIELSLHNLSDADSRQLIANLLEVEAIPEPIRALILQKAEGNPFFVEEVIRMLIEREVLLLQEGRWVARREIANVEIPDSLQALLLARIDRLPEATRHVLRIASVIGRQFSVRVLQEVLEKSV